MLWFGCFVDFLSLPYSVACSLLLPRLKDSFWNHDTPYTGGPKRAEWEWLSVMCGCLSPSWQKRGGKVCRRVSLSRFFLAAAVCFVFVSFCFVLRRCVLPFPCLHILSSPLSSDLCGMPQVIFIRFHAAWAVLTVLLFFVSILQFIHPALSASSWFSYLCVFFLSFFLSLSFGLWLQPIPINMNADDMNNILAPGNMGSLNESGDSDAHLSHPDHPDNIDGERTEPFIFLPFIGFVIFLI